MNLTKYAVFFTMGCGVAALAVAILPLIIPEATQVSMLVELFNTLIWLFSAGMGSLLFKALS